MWIDRLLHFFGLIAALCLLFLFLGAFAHGLDHLARRKTQGGGK